MRLYWFLCLPILLLAGEKQPYLGMALGSSQESGQESVGLIVFNVIEGHGADKAGIRANDKLLSLQGREVRSGQDVDFVLAKFSPGDSLEARIRRGKNIFTVTIVLGEVPETDEILLPFVGESLAGILKLGHFWLGLKGHNLSPALAKHFKVDSGVLVDQVFDEGPALEAGLKAGDIIIAVENEGVASKEEIGAILRRYKKGGQVNLKVHRAGRQLQLSMKLVPLSDVPEAYEMDLLQYINLGSLQEIGEIFLPRKSQ